MTILIPSHNEPSAHKMMVECEREFPQAQIIICNDRYGKGKGYAVRRAMELCEDGIICMIDGDLDIHPRMIHRLLPFLDDYHIVVGRKQLRRSLDRRVLTLLSRVYLYIFFGINYDTQTGVKIFRKCALNNWDTDGFMFDLEILLKAQKKGWKIIEVPVETTEFGASGKKMKLKNIFNCIKESWRIKNIA